jgi:hypothetical protein
VKKLKKNIIAILLVTLMIGAFGAAVASAVASDDTGIRYGSGPMHRWAARYRFWYRQLCFLSLLQRRQKRRT